MAIMANRYLTLLTLFVAASICYAVGFLGGVLIFVLAGIVFEGFFWFNLICRRKRP